MKEKLVDNNEKKENDEVKKDNGPIMVITEAIKNEDKIISNDTQKLIDTIDLKNQQLQNIVNEIKDIGMDQVSQNKLNAPILIIAGMSSKHC